MASIGKDDRQAMADLVQEMIEKDYAGTITEATVANSYRAIAIKNGFSQTQCPNYMYRTFGINKGPAKGFIPVLKNLKEIKPAPTFQENINTVFADRKKPEGFSTEVLKAIQSLVNQNDALVKQNNMIVATNKMAMESLIKAI